MGPILCVRSSLARCDRLPSTPCQAFSDYPPLLLTYIVDALGADTCMPLAAGLVDDGSVASALPNANASTSSIFATPDGTLIWSSSGALRTTADRRTSFYSANAQSLVATLQGAPQRTMASAAKLGVITALAVVERAAFNTQVFSVCFYTRFIH